MTIHETTKIPSQQAHTTHLRKRLRSEAEEQTAHCAHFSLVDISSTSHTPKRQKTLEGHEKHWAKAKKVNDTMVYTFSNGTKVVEPINKAKTFARFHIGAPVIRPEPHDLSSPSCIDSVIEEINTQGFSAVRVMEESEAQFLYSTMCHEYRELMQPSMNIFQKENPDLDLESIELTDLPKSLYAGRAGSGKLNSNGFPNSPSVWETRKKVANVCERIFSHHLKEVTPVMSATQLVFAWGPNLVRSLPTVESLPRAFPHLDYKYPLSDDDPLIRPGIQSVVVLTPSDDGDDPTIDQTTATLVFPGSHHFYEEIRKRNADYPKPSQGGLSWSLLTDMVNEGKLTPPIRVAVPQGCALVWSRVLAHSPHSGMSKRVALREAILPTSQVSLKNRLDNLVAFFTHSVTSGVETDGKVRILTLYGRRGSTVWRNFGWSKLPGVSDKFYVDVLTKSGGKEFHNVGTGELRKYFSPYELISYIEDRNQAKLLGFGDVDEIESLKKLTWKKV